MPNPLIFCRQVSSDEQKSISIETIIELDSQSNMDDVLKVSGIASKTFHISCFAQNYVLSQNGDEPTLSAAQLHDMPRTKFINVKPNKKEPVSLILGDAMNKGEVVAALKGLTTHQPTQWLMLTMLRQGLIKSTKDTEVLACCSDAIFKDASETEYQQFLTGASIENGYYIISGNNEVTIVDVQLLYGSTFNITCRDKVKKGDQPDMMYLTCYQLKEVDDSTVSVNIQDYTIIYRMTRLTLFLMLRHSDFLGELYSDELPILEDIKQQEISLGAKEDNKILDDNSVETVCRNESEKKYILKLDAIAQRSDVDMWQLYNAIVSCRKLWPLLEGISQFLTGDDWQYQRIVSSEEQNCHEKFAASFNDEVDNHYKLQCFVWYLSAEIKKTIKVKMFFDDVVLINLPLAKDSKQRCLLQYLLVDLQLFREFFSDSVDIILDDAKYWSFLRAGLAAKIRGMYQDHGVAICLFLNESLFFPRQKQPFVQFSPSALI